MAKIYGELVRAQFQLLASPPTPPVTGLVYYQTTGVDAGPKVYNGSKWVPAGGGSWTDYGDFDFSGADQIAISLTTGLQLYSVQFEAGSESAPLGGTFSQTPFGTSAPAAGTVIRLVGGPFASYRTMTLLHADVPYGCLLNGDMTLGRGSMIELQWVSALTRWVEVSRNMIGGI